MLSELTEGRPRDLGGFHVRRVLPAAQRRQLGAFTFLDHTGPVTLEAGHGGDVRAHPHIGLATAAAAEPPLDLRRLDREDRSDIVAKVHGHVNYFCRGGLTRPSAA